MNDRKTIRGYQHTNAIHERYGISKESAESACDRSGREVRSVAFLDLHASSVLVVGLSTRPQYIISWVPHSKKEGYARS